MYLAQFAKFLSKKMSVDFLFQLTFGVIILVAGVIFSCIISNNITKGLTASNTNISYLVILLHIMIIVFCVMIVRFILQRALTDIPLTQTILSLIGPTIGAASLFYSPFIKGIAVKAMLL